MFYLVPQVVYNQQWLDAVPRRRNPHQSHVTTMAPETTNSFLMKLK